MAGHVNKEKEIRKISIREADLMSPKLQISQLFDKAEFSTFLKCPACLDISIPPVFICATGHHICGNCRKKVKVCSLCNSVFSGARILFYEHIFDKISFFCRNANEGCQLVFLGRDFKKHLDVCDFRALPCIKYGCPNLKGIPFSNFVEHFVQVHNGKIIKNNGGKVCNGYPNEADTWIVSRWIHDTFYFQGHYFFAVAQIRKPEVGIWLWILGCEETAKKFRVRIKLGNDTRLVSGNKQTSLIWEGPIHPIRKEAEMVMNSGDCLITSISNIKALCVNQTQATNSRTYWEVQYEIFDKDAINYHTDYHQSPLFRNVTTRNRRSPIPYN